MGYAQEERRKLISKITATLVKTYDLNVDVDEEKLMFEIMAQHGASHQKAKEYIREARILLHYALNERKKEQAAAEKIIKEAESNATHVSP